MAPSFCSLTATGHHQTPVLIVYRVCLPPEIHPFWSARLHKDLLSILWPFPPVRSIIPSSLWLSTPACPPQALGWWLGRLAQGVATTQPIWRPVQARLPPLWLDVPPEAPGEHMLLLTLLWSDCLSLKSAMLLRCATTASGSLSPCQPGGWALRAQQVQR